MDNNSIFERRSTDKNFEIVFTQPGPTTELSAHAILLQVTHLILVLSDSEYAE
jgi:hypothetical protein